VPFASPEDFLRVMDAAYAAGVGIIWDFSKHRPIVNDVINSVEMRLRVALGG
jgi:hypothetical protein